jgi:hypothetical protein
VLTIVTAPFYSEAGSFVLHYLKHNKKLLSIFTGFNNKIIYICAERGNFLLISCENEWSSARSLPIPSLA